MLFVGVVAADHFYLLVVNFYLPEIGFNLGYIWDNFHNWWCQRAALLAALFFLRFVITICGLRTASLELRTRCLSSRLDARGSYLIADEMFLNLKKRKSDKREETRKTPAR